MKKAFCVLLIFFVLFPLYCQDFYRNYEFETDLSNYYGISLEVWMSKNAFKFIDNHSNTLNELFYKISLLLEDIEYFIEKNYITIDSFGLEYIIYAWMPKQSIFTFDKNWLKKYYSNKSYSEKYRLLNAKIDPIYQKWLSENKK